MPSKCRKDKQPETEGDIHSYVHFVSCPEPVSDWGEESKSATDVFTARIQDVIGSSYEISPLNVQDNTIQSLIQNIRVSIDIQKLWYTRN